jgi:hypothetical protein
MLRFIFLAIALLSVITAVVEIALPLVAKLFGVDLRYFWFTRSFLPEPEEERDLGEELERLEEIMDEERASMQNPYGPDERIKRMEWYARQGASGDRE